MTPEQATNAIKLIERADIKVSEIPLVMPIMQALAAIEAGKMIVSPVDDSAVESVVEIAQSATAVDQDARRA